MRCRRQQLGWLALAVCADGGGDAVSVGVSGDLPAAAFQPAAARARTYPSWQPVAIVSWCGMRGIVSLAAALALPLALPDGSAFPHRSLVICLAFAVILFTLVVQGLTLAPLIRLLRQGTDWSPVEEEHLAREAMTRAGLIEVDRFSREEGVPDDVRDPVRSEYEIRIKCVEPRQLAFTFADNLAPAACAARWCAPSAAS